MSVEDIEKPENMAAFFDFRAAGYDDHMRDIVFDDESDPLPQQLAGRILLNMADYVPSRQQEIIYDHCKYCPPFRKNHPCGWLTLAPPLMVHTVFARARDKSEGVLLAPPLSLSHSVRRANRTQRKKVLQWPIHSIGLK